MVGPRARPPGGITELIATWLEAGLADRVRLEQIHLCAAGAPRRRQAVQFAAGMLLLARRLARRSGGLIVHAHISVRGSFYRKAAVCAGARLRGVPYLLQSHSGEFRRWVEGRAHRRAIARRILGGASFVVVPAERWRRDALDLGARRVEVIGNCISGSEARRLAVRRTPVEMPEQPTVLYFGAWKPVKGLDLLARALGDLQPELGFRVRVFGAGDRGWLERQFAPLAGAVRIGGWLDAGRKAAELARATVFVQPSRSEAFATTLLEARASGIPIVASDAGAIPEVLEGYEGALLFDAGDQGACSEALRRALGGGVERRSRGSVPRRYQAEVAVDSLIDLYRRADAA